MSDSSDEIQIPFTKVVRFVRQFGHDLRNHLNAADLQSTYLAEIATDPELKAETKRLREMLSVVTASVQSVTTAVSPAKLTLMPYRADELLEDLRNKLASDFPEQSASISWSVAVGEAVLEIDPQVLQPALVELFANAFQHERAEEPMSVEARAVDHQLVLTLREPKPQFDRPTDQWGREPFGTIGHGHYGLGLHRARSIIEAHTGKLQARYDSSAATLITSVILPLSNNPA